MSKRHYPHNRVRYWYSYDIENICTLFADFRLHPQTVRSWIKNGLKIIDSGKPILIYGNDLISFLKTRNRQNKCSTEFEQCFCMKCQDARSFFRNIIVVDQVANYLKVRGVCRVCKKLMHQNYTMDDFPRLKKTFRLVDVSELYDLTLSTDKTHMGPQEQNGLNESDQGSLFDDM